MRLEKLAAGSIVLLLVYVSWARSGIWGPWLRPVWMILVLALVACVGRMVEAGPEVRRSVLRDPLLLVGLLFLSFLFVQWVNSGGEMTRDPSSGSYYYSDPRWPGWPYSIDTKMNWQPFVWFAPALLILLAVRHLFSRMILRWIFRSLLCNAMLLAILGLIQFFMGWDKLFGLIPFPSNEGFISTFGYTNHGGAFFYLMLAVAIGVVWDALEKRKSMVVVLGGTVLAVICALTALCSLSRFAVLTVFAVLFFALIFWIWHKRNSLGAGGLINIFLLGCVSAVLLYLSVVSLGDGAIVQEFEGNSVVKELKKDYMEKRGFQVPPAIGMFKDNPWFGVGGWSYRMMIGLYLPKEQWHMVKGGRANVHCDPLQFLAEHGVVGFGLMTVGLWIVLWPWRKYRIWRYKGLACMVAVGTGLIFIHSLIDLPFRCPTILWYWLILLALIPKLNELYEPSVEK